MNGSSHDAAARRIIDDLTPVRRLARPFTRSLPAAALALLMAAIVYLRLGVRDDAGTLGRTVLWGLSALQMAYGIVLVVLALRSAVPGRVLSRRSAAALLGGGAGLVFAITWLTWLTHASHVPVGREALYFAVCFRTPMVFGLPALILTVYLAFRAYPTRPALTGALAGLGAGLLSDGSWRTFCEVSDPAHVLSAHLASVVLLTAVGVVIASIAARRVRFTTSSAGPR